MATKKNYYVCFTFAKRPDIHMTLRYYPNLAPDQMAAVTRAIADFMSPEPRHPFKINFDLEAWYGPQHTVRVLEPRDSFVWPNWVLGLMTVLPLGSNKYKWYAHVACKDHKLRVQAVAVSLMCKKVEVARWDLV